MLLSIFSCLFYELPFLLVDWSTIQYVGFTFIVQKTCGFMVAFLFFSIIAGTAWYIWQASKTSRLRPQDTPGSIVRIAAAADSESVTMNVTALICTCANWQYQRQRFEAQTPMRLCRHLTAYYAKRSLPLPIKPYAPIVTLCALQGIGMPCGPGTEYGQTASSPYVLAAIKDEMPNVRLYLGSQMHTCNVLHHTWDTVPQSRARYFTTRARQLAETLGPVRS